MKLYVNILAFLFLYLVSYGQGPIPNSQATTGFLYPKEIDNQFYECGINDHLNCFENLSWYRNYINLSQLKVDPQLQMTSNYMFFGNVIGEVKRTGKGQIILIDQEINVIRKGAFANGFLKRRPDGSIIVLNPNAPYLDTDRLTYMGIQLPSLKEGQTDVTLKFDDVAVFTNYSLTGYSLQLRVATPKQLNLYTLNFGQEITIPLSDLLNSTITCTVKLNGTIINDICYKIPDHPYDPETLDLPYTALSCITYDDIDQDGIYDDFDNCVDVYNPYQQDTDGDGKGDACDDDIDNDGIPNDSDNCVYNFNPGQADSNNNGVGDVCEGDIDGDGILDGDDNCVYVSNYYQEDMDDDDIGDMCDDDMDGDGILNDDDNCIAQANKKQTDVDNDGIGDACDPDIDGDGIKNEKDNCPYTPNSDQSDIDGDGRGDVCDGNTGPDPNDPEVDLGDDCAIEPDLAGSVEAIEDFVVSWSGDTNAGDANLVVNDFNDFTTYCTANHPGVNPGTKGVVNYDIYINPERTTVKYPIIVCDGFDFTSTRDKDDIYKSFGGNATLRALWTAGYDLIICDFAGGGDFIQKNGFALQSFIKFVKEEYELNEIPALIGPSMGGQIIRFALLDWEANKVADWGPHNVQLFLSADSPWRGANASPALQALSYQNDEIDLFQMIRLMSNAPAARQMLINHVKEDGTSYQPRSHLFRSLLDAEYAVMGDVPTQVERIIAIADGNALGVSDANAPVNTTFLKITGDVEIGIGISVNAVKLKMRTIDKDEKIIEESGIAPGFHDVTSTLSGRNMDSAPGSPFNLPSAIKDGQTFKHNANVYGITIPVDIEVEYTDPQKRTFCFIPTYSALNVNTPNPYLNIHAGSQSGLLGFTHPLSPFDELFYDFKDDAHNGFDNEMNGINDFEFFLGTLSTLVNPNPGDVDCLIADGLLAGTDALLDLDLSFTCNSSGSTISCLNSLFADEIDWTIQQTGGSSDINFADINGAFTAVYTGDGSQDVSASYEVCAEINLNNCTTTICSDVTVNVAMTDNCVGYQGRELPSEEERITNPHKITISPNPAENQIQLDNQFKGSLLIYSLDGKLVQENVLNNFNERIALQIDTGFYFVKVLDENGTVVDLQKLIVAK